MRCVASGCSGCVRRWCRCVAPSPIEGGHPSARGRVSKCEPGWKEARNLLPQRYRPAADELKDAITSSTKSSGSEEDFERSVNNLRFDSEKSFTHLKGPTISTNSIGLGPLMGAMLLMIGFQSLLLGLVGGGVWTFANYEWLLPALLVQNLAQDIGLAVFVVRSLFKEFDQS